MTHGHKAMTRSMPLDTTSIPGEQGDKTKCPRFETLAQLNQLTSQRVDEKQARPLFAKELSSVCIPLQRFNDHSIRIDQKNF